MNHESATALFRAQATARLRGDTDEAARLAAQVGDGQLMRQVLFLTAFFGEVIVDEFGGAPDPGDLAELTKRLHDKHFPSNADFNALRAEAMIRAVCGESVLITAIPFAEQTGYIWAVVLELVEPDITDTRLSELFERAEASGMQWMSEAFEATIGPRAGRTPAPEQSAPEPPEAERPAQSAPAQSAPEPRTAEPTTEAFAKPMAAPVVEPAAETTAMPIADPPAEESA